MKETAKYALSGALAGVINGVFGAGGGMVLIPMFCRVCKMEEKNAFATSVSVVLPMSAVSSVIYLLRQDMNFLTALPFLVGGLLGGFVGGRVFKRVPTLWLKRIFALFLLYGGVRSLFF